jgi:predicted nucleotidyltransferase
VVSKSEIENAIKLLVETYVPVYIFIFGSYAWGTPHKDSDVDFLVVVKDSKEPFHKRPRIGHKALSETGFPKDILVLTETELNLKIKEAHSFYAEIVEKGVKSYEAA